jgi:uncharacterized RDD family membrane protein YckC
VSAPIVEQPSRTKARDVALGAAVVGSRACRNAGRIALLPLRTASRAPLVAPVLRRAADELAADGRAARADGRRRVDDLTDEVLAAPEVEQTVDRALAGPLTEAIGRSLADNQVPRRIAAEFLAHTRVEPSDAPATSTALEHAAARPSLEDLVAEVIESRLATDLADRVVRSPEFEHAVESVASSPAVRAALAAQTRSLVDDVVDDVRSATERFDDSAERSVRRWLPGAGNERLPRAEQPRYGGLATRAMALLIDVALADLLALGAAAGVYLAASVVGGLRPSWLVGVLVAVGWALVVDVYLLLFWTMTGRTPGMRLMRLRVVGPRGDPPGLGRAVVRLVGLFLAIALFFAGFLPVLVDRRRRGVHDMLAGTVVESTEPA